MPKRGSFSWPGSVIVTRAIEGELYCSGGSQPLASDSPFYLFSWFILSMKYLFTRINEDATEVKCLIFLAGAYWGR